MYVNGEYGKQDFISAYMWFHIDAANGNANTVKARDLIKKN